MLGVSLSFREGKSCWQRVAYRQAKEEDGWPRLLRESVMEFSPPLHSIFPCHRSWVLHLHGWNILPSVCRWQMWQHSELWDVIQSERHAGQWVEARNTWVGMQTMELSWPPGVLERPWRTLEGWFATQLSSSCLPFSQVTLSPFHPAPPPPSPSPPSPQATLSLWFRAQSNTAGISVSISISLYLYL